MYYTMNRACPNIVAFNGLEQVKEVTEAIKCHFNTFMWEISQRL